MSITIYDVECDRCERGFAIDDVFNVDYFDGTSNVLCADCATEAEANEDDIERVWQ
jgi:hypothetical protein